METEGEVGRRGIPSLLKPSSSSSDGVSGREEHIASDVTQVRSSYLFHSTFFRFLFVAVTGSLGGMHERLRLFVRNNFFSS
jgi:hypothetical protein